MAAADVQVLRDLFAAVNDGDYARSMAHYAEDAVLVVDADTFLEPGTHRGRDAVGRFFAGYLAAFEPGYHFELDEVHDLGDRVLLFATHRGRGRASGVEVGWRTAYLCRLDAGKVIRIEVFADRERAFAAARVSG